jgi:PEP-CTERM motif
MNTNRLHKNWYAGLALGITLLASQSTQASPLYSGTITASFSNPVLAGNIINLAGVPEFLDNSATAVYSILNLGSVAEVISGDAGSTGAGRPSEIIFFGNSFSGVTPGQEFELGTMTFNNGTSNLSSSIFGATLTLTVPEDPSVTPISTSFSLVTTRNGGFSPFLDADFLSFPSPLSINFHVLEGAGATAIVLGKIVGDPQLQLTQLQLAPNQSGNGFLTATPEPGTLLLLVSGLAGVGFVQRRPRQTKSVGPAGL